VRQNGRRWWYSLQVMGISECQTCKHPKASEINRRLLAGERSAKLGPEFGIKRSTLAYHRRHHLPWRNRSAKKPVTVQEKMEFLEYRHERLLARAACGEKIGEELRVLQAQRSLLELQMRSQHLVESHRPVLVNKEVIADGYEISFVDGRPKTSRRAHPTAEGRTREEIRVHGTGTTKAEV
jgi:hypothetical protein